MDAIIRSVTTILGLFTLIVMGLVYFACNALDPNLDHSTQVWSLISAGVILVLIIISVTLLGIFKKDVLFYSVYAHILELQSRLGASGKEVASQKLIDSRKTNTPPKDTR